MREWWQSRLSPAERATLAQVEERFPRSLFHLLGIALIAGLALLLPRGVLLWSLGGVAAAYLALDGSRLVWKKLNLWFFSLFLPLLRGEEASRLTGVTYTLAASLLCFIAFPTGIAIVSLLFLAVGDPLGALIGPWGRRWLWGRTLEGHLAFFVPCLAVGLGVGFLLLGLHPLVLLVGAVGATLVHALPLPVNDNLTIPLSAALAMVAMGLWI